MPKKAIGKGKLTAAATAIKIKHENPMRTNIRSGMAVAGPPLGSMLGQRGINIAAFCKDFNNRTSIYREGIPLPTRVFVKPDRSYEMVIHQPPVSYFLKQAAGITRGAMDSGSEICGKVSLRHIYEIALIKKQDPPLQLRPLKELCNQIIGSARSIGIQVVDDLDPDEYKAFLEERKLIVEEQLAKLAEEKEAKMLRKK